MLSLRVPLVLASASPRRRILLRQIGLDPDVRPSHADETWPGGDHGTAVEALALRKAQAVPVAGALVLGADTVVVLDDEVIGKPPTPADAGQTLRRLSGRTHTVYTGVALVHDARHATVHRATQVTFAELSDAEIDAYVATGSPLDKAGAYGIQDDAGSLFVTSVEGDYPSVIGLPLRAVYETLTRHFADLIAAP